MKSLSCALVEVRSCAPSRFKVLTNEALCLVQSRLDNGGGPPPEQAREQALRTHKKLNGQAKTTELSSESIFHRLSNQRQKRSSRFVAPSGYERSLRFFPGGHLNSGRNMQHLPWSSRMQIRVPLLQSSE